MDHAVQIEQPEVARSNLAEAVGRGEHQVPVTVSALDIQFDKEGRPNYVAFCESDWERTDGIAPPPEHHVTTPPSIEFVWDAIPTGLEPTSGNWGWEADCKVTRSGRLARVEILEIRPMEGVD